MKDMGLEGIICGKKYRTTIPDKSQPCPLDKVNRQFKAPAPNMLWVSDFTYVATWQGFVYVPSLSTPSPAVSSGGASAGRRMPVSYWMRWNRLFINASLALVCCIIPTADRNTCPFAIPNGWLRLGSNRPSTA